MQYTNNTSNSSGKSGNGGKSKLCNSVWCVVANIGRGSYGHAILMRRTSMSAGTVHNSSTNTSERAVYKVDINRDSVLWEAFIHMQVCLSFTFKSFVFLDHHGVQCKTIYVQMV